MEGAPDFVMSAYMGHVILGHEDRGERCVSLPGVRLNGDGPGIKLSVNASAQLGCHSSPTMVAAFAHSCEANTEGVWWMKGPIRRLSPCAVELQRLCHSGRLCTAVVRGTRVEAQE